MQLNQLALPFTVSEDERKAWEKHLTNLDHAHLVEVAFACGNSITHIARKFSDTTAEYNGLLDALNYYTYSTKQRWYLLNFPRSVW